MKRRTFVAGVAASGASVALAESGLAQESAGTATPAAEASESTPQSGYAPVNGLQMYYEIHGARRAAGAGAWRVWRDRHWGPILSTLAEDQQVIAVELQGHGRTADIDRPFSYEQISPMTWRA